MTRRFERVDRKGIKFTTRDRETIIAVYEARYMTNQQVGRLFYRPSSMSYCRQRLRYLFDRGFLRKRPAYNNEPDIYYLGLRGRNYIAEQLKLPRDYVDPVAGVGTNATLPLLHMRHDLFLTDLYVEGRIQADINGWDFEWKNARMLELEKLGVQPDGWLMLSKGGDWREAYLEFTYKVPAVRFIDAKLDGYARLWERKRRACLVLWFVSTKSKARQMADRVLKHPYRECFLVSLIEDKRGYLTNPIWWSAENQDGVCLLEKPEKKRAGGRQLPPDQSLVNSGGGQ